MMRIALIVLIFDGDYVNFTASESFIVWIRMLFV